MQRGLTARSRTTGIGQDRSCQPGQRRRRSSTQAAGGRALPLDAWTSSPLGGPLVARLAEDRRARRRASPIRPSRERDLGREGIGTAMAERGRALRSGDRPGCDLLTNARRGEPSGPPHPGPHGSLDVQAGLRIMLPLPCWWGNTGSSSARRWSPALALPRYYTGRGSRLFLHEHQSAGVGTEQLVLAVANSSSWVRLVSAVSRIRSSPRVREGSSGCIRWPK
jgi:hypothetical protein